MDDYDSAENCTVTDNLTRPKETKPCYSEWVGFRYRLKWLFTSWFYCFTLVLDPDI